MFIGVFYFLFFSGYCDIRGITVSGAEKIQEDAVRAAIAEMFDERSMFL